MPAGGYLDYERADRRRAARSRSCPIPTSGPPPRCATRPAPRATRKACSTRTARSCCTRSALALDHCMGIARARRHAAGRADVPRQRVGHAVRGDDGRREDRAAGSAPRSGEPRRSVRARARDDHRRRADDLDGRAAAARRQSRRVRPVVDPRDVCRRLRRAAGADRSVRAAARAEDRPGLGHDRDWRRSARSATCRRHRRRTATRRSSRYRAKQGRPSPFVEIRARNEDGLVAVGRQDDGRARGARTVDRAALLQPRRLRRSLHRRRLVPAPATSSRSTTDGDDPDAGPVEGSDQVGRRVDQLGRARVRADGPSGGRRSGGDSRGAREVGRAAAGRRRAQAGPDGIPDELRAFLAPNFPQVLAARRVRVHRRDSAHVRRQVQEERAARAVQGLPQASPRPSTGPRVSSAVP